MQKVLTAAEMREVDRLTTERYGIPSILLMENAAHAVARVITEKLGGSVKGKSILVLCGPGNNGGDGAALARILWTLGAEVTVAIIGQVADTKGDAQTNFEILQKLNERDRIRVDVDRLHFEIFEYEDVYTIECPDVASWKSFLDEPYNHNDSDVVVDALFGTGLTRPLEGVYEEVASYIAGFNLDGNIDSSLVVSLDIPSGIDADDSQLLGGNPRAHVTVTFTAPKRGNVIPPVSDANGELIVAQIGSPQELVRDQPSRLYIAEAGDIRSWVKKTNFSEDSYKNKRGHCLIIAGSESYSGAAVLAGDAAMRSGVGLVTIATPNSSKESIAARVLPEVMVRGVAETNGGAVAEEALNELNDLLEKADAIAVGSGLSQDESTKRFVEKLVRRRTQPMVVDADALNLLSPLKENHPDAAASPLLRKEGSLPPLILTPHEGEFMRLLGTDDKDVLKDRVAAVREFSQKHQVILVLKGERVLVGEPGGKVVVNPTGNSGLGKAGNGDTLTGIIAGFVAQAAKMNIDIFETVIAAVYIAGMAGDVAEKKLGKRVMTASDVRECLVDAFSSLVAD